MILKNFTMETYSLIYNTVLSLIICEVLKLRLFVYFYKINAYSIFVCSNQTTTCENPQNNTMYIM